MSLAHDMDVAVPSPEDAALLRWLAPLKSEMIDLRAAGDDVWFDVVSTRLATDGMTESTLLPSDISDRRDPALPTSASATSWFSSTAGRT